MRKAAGGGPIQGAGDIGHALRDAYTIPNYRYLHGDGEVLIELDWRGRSSGHPAHISMFQPDIFDDVVGRGFALVSSQDVCSVLGAAQLAFLADLGATTATVAAGAHDFVEDVDGTYPDFWETQGVQAFISRPDYHLFWAGRIEELPAVVDELRARLAWVAAPTSAGVPA